MSFLKRRLRVGVPVIIGLTVLALMLWIAQEWRQALANIDAMIVTPVTLPKATADLPSLDANVATTPEHDADMALADIHPDLRSTQATVPTPGPPLPDSSLNILLLGTDARPDQRAPRTDAIVLIHLDRKRDRASMLSIPRDLWVTYPGYGKGRINAAYAVGEEEFGPGGGAALAKETVSNLVGLEVDHFALVNFQGFNSLIDLLGGITIDVPEAIYDPAFPTDDYSTKEVRFRTGPQRMNGERALTYVRTRHADSDFGRNQRQQLVLMALFERVRERGLLQQITSLDDYTGVLRDYVYTDMPKRTMIDLAQWGHNLDYNDVQRYAINSSAIVELQHPATFAAEPKVLRRIVGKFTGGAISSAGGQ